MSHKTDTLPFFGIGNAEEGRYWMALIRQMLVAKLLEKDIETYGVLRISAKGRVSKNSRILYDG